MSNPTERVDALIALTERLTSLISQECRAFEARRPQDALVTLDETSRLANSTIVETAPLEKRRELMRATEAFDAVLARHGRAIEAARIVTEGIVKAVADEVVRTRTTGAGYGPGAAPEAGSATAITLNKSA